MRRFPFLLIVGVGLSIALVAFASASGSTGKGTTAIADENTAYPWMPAGEDPPGSADNNWEYPDGDNAHSDYSLLNQINTSNASKLQLAWQDTLDGPTYAGNLEGVPIVVSGKNNNLRIRAGRCSSPPTAVSTP